MRTRLIALAVTIRSGHFRRKNARLETGALDVELPAHLSGAKVPRFFERPSPSGFGHGPVNFTLGIAFGNVLTLVRVALAGAEADEQFGLPSKEVDFQRDERGAFLAGLVCEFAYFTLLCKQRTCADGVVLAVLTSGGVFGNVNAVKRQPEWGLVGPDITLRETGLAGSQGFDLGAGEFHAALERVVNDVVIACTSVFDRWLVDGLFGLFGHWDDSASGRGLSAGSPVRHALRSAATNAQKRTRTSTGFYSHQHLKLARLPIPPPGLLHWNGEYIQITGVVESVGTSPRFGCFVQSPTKKNCTGLIQCHSDDGERGRSRDDNENFEGGPS